MKVVDLSFVSSCGAGFRNQEYCPFRIKIKQFQKEILETSDVRSCSHLQSTENLNVQNQIIIIIIIQIEIPPDIAEVKKFWQNILEQEVKHNEDGQ